MIIRSSKMKRRPELVRECIDLRPCFLELVDRGKISVEGSVVESSPAVGVYDVHVSVALEDRLKSLCLLDIFLVRQHGFVDWSLAHDR